MLAILTGAGQRWIGEIEVSSDGLAALLKDTRGPVWLQVKYPFIYVEQVQGERVGCALLPISAMVPQDSFWVAVESINAMQGSAANTLIKLYEESVQKVRARLGAGLVLAKAGDIPPQRRPQ